MVALGVGTLWFGYTITMWGYCLVRSYDVTFPALFKSQWPGAKITYDTPGQVVRPGGRKLGAYLPDQGTA